MGINERFDGAVSVIEEHNSVIGGKNNPGYVDSDEFISRIKSVGGTSEARLKRFSYEEILECMPDVDGRKPNVLAKEIAAIFRGNPEEDRPGQPRPIGSKKAERMTAEELVHAFDPEEYSNAVGKRLQAMSKGEPFIVFESGRIVDAGMTQKMLDEVKQGFPGRTKVEVGDLIKQVYRIGQLPDSYAQENPLYPLRPLRPDGTCDQLNRSWDGVSQEVRQLVYLAVAEGELKVDIEAAHNIMDIVIGDSTAFKKLSKRYPNAALAFEKHKSMGNLPQLVLAMPIGEMKPGFGGGKKVTFGSIL